MTRHSHLSSVRASMFGLSGSRALLCALGLVLGACGEAQTLGATPGSGGSSAQSGAGGSPATAAGSGGGPGQSGSAGVPASAGGAGNAMGGNAGGGAGSADIQIFGVTELSFEGPSYGPKDAPARDVDLSVTFKHQDGQELTVLGFWDGGSLFKVRFTPTLVGSWTVSNVKSNQPKLDGQHEGEVLLAAPSALPGFWLKDAASPGLRWYERSNGSHDYVFGNTHYDFLSEQDDSGANGSSIGADIAGNAKYFKKLRFSVVSDRFVHPTDKPFFDDAGKPTDDANYSHRPNPVWFGQRVDRAVQSAFDLDLVADLILNGPDASTARSALKAGKNGGDATPYLKYIAARYGSYPNVWLCLSNEWDIKTPSFSAQEMTKAGQALASYLAYPVPLSVHGNEGDWNTALNTKPDWNDHVIIQQKIRGLSLSADAVAANYGRGGGNKPVINDELGYQGAGDDFSELDILRGHVGAFLGGGYGSTAFKPTDKKGQYFWGHFDATEHSAADNLGWLGEQIDSSIPFFALSPLAADSAFANAPKSARLLGKAGDQYVLGTDAASNGIVADLPAGSFEVFQLDVVKKTRVMVSAAASGHFAFDVPASLVLTHFQRK